MNIKYRKNRDFQCERELKSYTCRESHSSMTEDFDDINLFHFLINCLVAEVFLLIKNNPDSISNKAKKSFGC